MKLSVSSLILLFFLSFLSCKKKTQEEAIIPTRGPIIIPLDTNSLSHLPPLSNEIRVIDTTKYGCDRVFKFNADNLPTEAKFENCYPEGLIEAGYDISSKMILSCKHTDGINNGGNWSLMTYSFKNFVLTRTITSDIGPPNPNPDLEWVLNAANNILFKINKTLNDTSSVYNYISGQLISIDYPSIKEKTIFNYQSQGLLESVEHFNQSNTLTTRTTFAYTNKNEWKSAYRFDPKKPNDTLGVEYVYYKNGTIKEIYSKKIKNWSISGKTIIESAFDRHEVHPYFPFDPINMHPIEFYTKSYLNLQTIHHPF